jgi:hypothetical protein
MHFRSTGLFDRRDMVLARAHLVEHIPRIVVADEFEVDAFGIDFPGIKWDDPVVEAAGEFQFWKVHGSR